MTDAIIRSVWRVAVSRKNMLEWVTAADSDRRFRGELSDYWHKMKNASLVSLALCVTASMVRPDIWYISLIIALIWLTSPYIAYKIGKPKKKHLPMLSAEQILHIRQSAVKTWRYFDELVNESGKLASSRQLSGGTLRWHCSQNFPHKYRASFNVIGICQGSGIFKHLEHS